MYLCHHLLKIMLCHALLIFFIFLIDIDIFHLANFQVYGIYNFKTSEGNKKQIFFFMHFMFCLLFINIQ